jgi:uncharacterized protein YaaQ
MHNGVILIHISYDNEKRMASTQSQVNQLVFIVVSERQADELLKALVKERFYFTKIDSSGMIFQEPTLCLLIGLNSTRRDALMELVGQCCRPFEEYIPVQFNAPAGFPPMSMIEARAGGALVYVLDVERFEQF